MRMREPLIKCVVYAMLIAMLWYSPRMPTETPEDAYVAIGLTLIFPLVSFFYLTLLSQPSFLSDTVSVQLFLKLLELLI